MRTYELPSNKTTMMLTVLENKYWEVKNLGRKTFFLSKDVIYAVFLPHLHCLHCLYCLVYINFDLLDYNILSLIISNIFYNDILIMRSFYL